MVILAQRVLRVLERKVCGQGDADQTTLSSPTETWGSHQRNVARDVRRGDKPKFVVIIFALSHDGRLRGWRAAQAMATGSPVIGPRPKARKPMSQVFPALRDVKSNTLGRGARWHHHEASCRFSATVAPNIVASGYSGHGVGTAIHAAADGTCNWKADGRCFDT